LGCPVEQRLLSTISHQLVPVLAQTLVLGLPTHGAWVEGEPAGIKARVTYQGQDCAGTRIEHDHRASASAQRSGYSSLKISIDYLKKFEF
jgi:hypothetical protein